MAKKPPQKGAPQWHPLPNAPEGYEDVEIGIKYVGAHEARRWMIQMQKLGYEEKGRQMKDEHPASMIEALRIELLKISKTKDLAEARDIATAALKQDRKQSLEHVEAVDKLAAEVLSKCIYGARGVEGVKEDDAQGALDLLEYLGEEVEAAVFVLSKEQQQLTLRQQFRPESSSSGE